MSSVGSNVPTRIPPPTILTLRFTIFPPASAVSVLRPTGGANPSEEGRAICDIDTPKYASRIVHPCEMLRRGGIVAKPMAAIHKNSGLRLHNSGRRVVVVAVPPVDELDLVGPLQVFSSVNRLAGRNIYDIEVVTNADRLTVEGEGGVLTFMAKHHFSKVDGACDSVLLVCGLGSRSVRDAMLSTWLKKMAAEVRRLGAVCVGAFLLAEAGLLNDRRATTHWRFGREMATRYPGVRVQHDPLWVKE